MKCKCGAAMRPVEWVGLTLGPCIICGAASLGNGIVYECNAHCGGKACKQHAEVFVATDEDIPF